MDKRGTLSVIDFGANSIPFVPRRIFYIYGAGSHETRGMHAHKECHQLMIQVTGQCILSYENRLGKNLITLNDPGVGVYLPPLTWGSQHGFSANSCLMVLTSEPYDEDDYIRNYDEFLRRISD